MADKLWGDPPGLPHPVAGFGKIILVGEKRANKGKHKPFKGALFAVGLIAAVFFPVCFLLQALQPYPWASLLLSSVIVFFCLAGKTLIGEVRQVFAAVDLSVAAGRTQVARIVGRDTSSLSPQQIRTAALETLAENLSDGVIAPLFWFLLLGAPGMLAYKMVNTLDSMIGYKNEPYRQFGCWAARIDDVANYLPARLTAFLMLLVSGKLTLLPFVKKYGCQHASPNSGYPEAALAGILNCRFGGPNTYFGETVNKPYIGSNRKELTAEDLEIAVRINKKAETAMVILTACCVATIHILLK
jgi:adenosylcobinamide-phosphate synthase